MNDDGNPPDFQTPTSMKTPGATETASPTFTLTTEQLKLLLQRDKPVPRSLAERKEPDADRLTMLTGANLPLSQAYFDAASCTAAIRNADAFWGNLFEFGPPAVSHPVGGAISPVDPSTLTVRLPEGLFPPDNGNAASFLKITREHMKEYGISAPGPSDDLISHFMLTVRNVVQYVTTYGLPQPVCLSELKRVLRAMKGFDEHALTVQALFQSMANALMVPRPDLGHDAPVSAFLHKMVPNKHTTYRFESNNSLAQYLNNALLYYTLLPGVNGPYATAEAIAKGIPLACYQNHSTVFALLQYRSPTQPWTLKALDEIFQSYATVFANLSAVKWNNGSHAC